MPSTGRHAHRASLRRATSQVDGNQLYPTVPPVELEMENLEERRVYFKNVLKDYGFFIETDFYSMF